MAKTVYVPVSGMGCGTGRAAVADARSGGTVDVDAPRVVLVDRVVCLAAEPVDTDGPLALCRFGGRLVWVRPLAGPAPRRAA